MEIPGYKIIRAIGVGGMATAYLATQSSLGRQVVLKVLDTSNDISSKNVERFMNEARIVASLRHPNVITIYDVGRHQNLIYISMEYIEGGDLKSRMSEGISPYEALDIVKKITGALDCAHKSGVIHRDVKPANILFRKDGTPLLTDFGIAKKLTVDHDLTSTGIFLGSPNYMAPEQAEESPIDGRADIYSLGIIFYEMLTGNKPYRAESVVDIILQHRQGALPKLPPDWKPYEPLLYLMIAKKRKDRFHDAESLLHFIRDMERRGIAGAGQRQAATAAAHGDTTSGSTLRLPTWSSARTTPHTHAKTYVRTSLLLLLVVTAIGFGLLQYYARELAEAPLQPTEGLLPRLDASVSPPATGATPVAAAGPATEDVRKALIWLAQKSLADDRLISPPDDNAYFYYSRLRDIDPQSDLVEKGFKRIAERFALLAEHEMAQNNRSKAQTYVMIGLQMDPNNEALRQLRVLTKPRQRSLIQTILGAFRSTDEAS
ncbi:MAG: serine/threonine-protein kinase [Chromatiales bacterium]